MRLRALVLPALLTACVTSGARPTTEPTLDASAAARDAASAPITSSAPTVQLRDGSAPWLDAAAAATGLPEAPRPVSGLPLPPGAANLPRPAGTAAHNLRVLSWAGFQAAASYTFDDGQPSHLEHWAELKATKVPVTFYITTGYRGAEPGFDATWRDVVASGSELGNHTVDHCYYSGMSCGANGTSILSPKSRELDDASDYIVKTTGQSEVWTAATPFGDDAWSVETQSRFLLTRGTIAGVGGDGMVAPNDGNDTQNLPTRNAEEGETSAVFSGYLDNARSGGKWVILLFHSIAPTSSRWFATVDISSITGSIQHGQQLGDLWLDSVVHVGAYWLAEKIFSSAVPQVAGGQTRWQWQVPAHYPRGRFLRVRVDGGTLIQNERALPWDSHGYYEVAFDAGELRWSP